MAWLFLAQKPEEKFFKKSAEKTIESPENQRTVYLDKDRNTQNYKKQRDNI